MEHPGTGCALPRVTIVAYLAERIMSRCMLPLLEIMSEITPPFFSSILTRCICCCLAMQALIQQAGIIAAIGALSRNIVAGMEFKRPV